jgi:hypothetical protein
MPVVEQSARLRTAEVFDIIRHLFDGRGHSLDIYDFEALARAVVSSAFP